MNQLEAALRAFVLAESTNRRSGKPKGWQGAALGLPLAAIARDIVAARRAPKRENRKDRLAFAAAAAAIKRRLVAGEYVPSLVAASLGDLERMATGPSSLELLRAKVAAACLAAGELPDEFADALCAEAVRLAVGSNRGSVARRRDLAGRASLEDDERTRRSLSVAARQLDIVLSTTKTDAEGRQVTSFYGSPRAAYADFLAPAQKVFIKPAQ